MMKLFNVDLRFYPYNFLPPVSCFNLLPCTLYLFLTAKVAEFFAKNAKKSILSGKIKKGLG